MFQWVTKLFTKNICSFRQGDVRVNYKRVQALEEPWASYMAKVGTQPPLGMGKVSWTSSGLRWAPQPQIYGQKQGKCVGIGAFYRSRQFVFIGDSDNITMISLTQMLLNLISPNQYFMLTCICISLLIFGLTHIVQQIYETNK